MCGIAGYINKDSSVTSSLDLIKQMTDCLAHRGPDGEGFYLKDSLALGHRRLSIVDLDTGNQPMVSLEEKLVIVFNGEIYNYIELREELSVLGHVFLTKSDTEVVLKAYQQWGLECQQRFNGMWAFVLWDADKKELLLSRDRFGEKPLFYSVTPEAFVFASELKSLFRFGVKQEIRSELTELYLALTNIPAPDTFYKGIYKLKPAHYLIFKQGTIVCEKPYWEFPQVDEREMLKDKAVVYDEFGKLFRDAVKIRMRCDVPFGAFLSGGLDSSAVVSVMSSYSALPVHTFTIGFEQPEYDERALAEKVALQYATDHTVAVVQPASFSEVLSKTSRHFGEPFGDSSAIPTDIVSAHAATKVKMVLTGDGGDELLGGYTMYKAVKFNSLVYRYLPRLVRSLLAQVIGIVSRISGGAKYRLQKLKRSIEGAGEPFYRQIARNTAFADLDDIRQMTNSIPGIVRVEDYFKNLLAKCRFDDNFYKLMYIHYHHHLPNDFLVKVDRMSMANSLETRLPFLDYRLVEFMAKVHKDVKMQGWELKSVLRNSIGSDLPDAILNAPKKGFAVPLKEWFKDQNLYEELKTNLACVQKSFGKANVSKIIQENATGAKDHGNFIWTLLQLEKYLNLETH